MSSEFHADKRDVVDTSIHRGKLPLPTVTRRCEHAESTPEGLTVLGGTLRKCWSTVALWHRVPWTIVAMTPPALMNLSRLPMAVQVRSRAQSSSAEEQLCAHREL